MKKHRISVSMIVKNEESCLAKALESVKDADEIIVCDTGSTDQTIEIARQYTDKVFTDYKWNDNFAEARNHAQSKCTGDYILIIDADEYLEPGKMDELRTFDGKALNFQTISSGSGQMHYSIRLHKNDPDVKWIGSAHNYLNVPPSHTSAIKMYFDYSESHAKDPDRTLRILQKYLKKTPGKQREMYYLGIEYINRGQYDKAFEVYKKYLKNGTINPEYIDVLILKARLYLHRSDFENAKKLTLRAIELNPDFKEAHQLMGDLSVGVNRLKWHAFAQKCENRNVLFVRDPKRIVVTQLAVEDFAGSGFQIVQAVRNAEPKGVDIEQIVLNKSAFGIPCGPTMYDAGLQTVQDRLNRSDIIHFKGDFAHNRTWGWLALPENAKRIYTVGGSFFRRHGDARISQPKHGLNEYVADYKTALSPDLIYEDGWHWTPHPYNVFKKTWKRGDVFRITHFPSDPVKKNTALILAAFEIVKNKRKDVELISMTGKKHHEVIKAKAESHIYCDQFLCDFYANAAIEALAFGVPVLTWLDGYKYYPDGCPVQTPDELTAESIAAKIIEMCDWDRLEELSKKSFEYAQNVHGTMGKKWVEIYKQLTT
jgi:glycosyltransferase involved in cell wall biosynthesis